MPRLDLETYKELVSIYLQGDYAAVADRLLTYNDRLDVFRDLLEIRLIIAEKKFHQSDKILARIKMNKDMDDLQKAEFHFLSARLSYFLYQTSRDQFLRAADLYRKMKDWEAYFRSRINATLDLMEENDWPLIEKELSATSQVITDAKLSDKHVAHAQLNVFRARSLLAQDKLNEVFDLYLSSYQMESFSALPQSDKNNFAVYAIEAATYLNQIDVARMIARKIQNPQLAVQNSLAFFEWLWQWAQTAEVPPVQFNAENLSESLREKAMHFISLSQGHPYGTFNKDPQLNAWIQGAPCPLLKHLNNGDLSKSDRRKNSDKETLGDRLLAALQEGPKTKWELIDILYGKTDDLAEVEKLEGRLYRFISKMNKQQDLRIENKKGSYFLSGATEKTRFRSASRTELILEKLRVKPASLQEIANYIFFHPLNNDASDYQELHDQIKRTLRKLRSDYGVIIMKEGEFYHLSEQKD